MNIALFGHTWSLFDADIPVKLKQLFKYFAGCFFEQVDETAAFG